MKITIDNGWELRERFKAYDRDYYSIYGYEALLDFYNEIDEDWELDVIAICGDWTEYDSDLSCFENDLINDFGYLVEDIDNIPFEDVAEYITEALEERTTVIKLDNGNLLVMAF